ncbi:response regulator [Oceanibaculum pacificum]|uniref:Response regulatory domain-containing protein n=1 Tax=Oceanibaculum pacificum TaxID=580166 RepID=A0A154VYL0_9PROT|nr:response regulator [Oceanibaculum pacificum]KZD06345.1 hypothetical protein AUP43_10900 [Oceanibaculum pacificum]
MLNGQLTILLPALRRYASGLTGSGEAGDLLVAEVLKRILGGDWDFNNALPARYSLFRGLHQCWEQAGESLTEKVTDLGAALPPSPLYRILQKLAPMQRAVLILNRLEGFKLAEVATILDLLEVRVARLLAEAEGALMALFVGRILIVEDDALTAMELEQIVTLMGHQVIGPAVTRDEAVALASSEKPDLILSDIELDDQVSGVEAMQQIRTLRHVPVIFVTAFPDRAPGSAGLLDSYIIPKPFNNGMMTAFITNALLSRPLPA